MRKPSVSSATPDELSELAAYQMVDDFAQLILDPANPLPTAHTFVERYHAPGGFPLLWHHLGVFYEYQAGSNAYSELDGTTIRAKLYDFLEPAKRWTEPKRKKPA